MKRGNRDATILETLRGATLNAMMKRFREVTLVFLLAFFSIAIRTHAQGSGRLLPEGTWGGEHITLEVSGKGAEVEFDCAHGWLAQPIALDKRGDFDIAGTFTAEHGGPVLRDEKVSDRPAHYAGHVEDGTMTLTVVVGTEKSGSFTLTQGSTGKVTKCR
ncbi:MAG: hypothetical protein DMG80_14100 [Acidobacteria bacterium]|nr:MAG: hypothetical protein DMG80_14100 [Acidobacteriota bacterium]